MIVTIRLYDSKLGLPQEYKGTRQKRFKACNLLLSTSQQKATKSTISRVVITYTQFQLL